MLPLRAGAATTGSGRALGSNPPRPFAAGAFAGALNTAHAMTPAMMAMTTTRASQMRQ